MASLVRLTILRWAPVVVWMAVIFAFSSTSSLPTAPSTLVDALIKKGAHFGEFAVLAILVFRAIDAERSSVRQRAFLALGVSLAYAVIDELHQSLVPGRNPSPFDLLIDSAGAIAGLTTIMRIRVKSAG